MTVVARRTQQQRREATIGRLLSATIDCLAEHGYRETSIGRICARAELSHGGLFRHFASRTALLGAATDEILRRHIESLREMLKAPQDSDDYIEDLVNFCRAATRDRTSAAWREIIVASRTDEELRAAIEPAVRGFEDAVMTVAEKLPQVAMDSREFGTLILSFLHMFDSEASTVVVFETPEIEAYRHRWCVELLRSAFEKSAS